MGFGRVESSRVELLLLRIVQFSLVQFSLVLVQISAVQFQFSLGLDPESVALLCESRRWLRVLVSACVYATHTHTRVS